ncbi:hypothetical protein [Fulvivirga ligni]|uniref:hypothetical protein n=1 Tax=Fulvivirga ligni TaxID=2904246 RepID=UPI001F262373|nr:hypothetical protein [Fulvivirga ligni]UII20380.1 hypothetical protein LVD16_21290 [Fulvivirga ligni]
MKNIKLYTLVTILSLGLVSCMTDCNCPNAIKVHDAFKAEIDEQEYCSLLNKSLAGDSLSFRNLIGYSVDGGLMLDHSSHISKLVKMIGREQICIWISTGSIDSNLLNEVLDFNSYHSFSKEEYDIYFTSESKFKCDF